MLFDTLDFAPSSPSTTSSPARGSRSARHDALLAFHLDHLQSHGPHRPVTLPNLTGLRGR